MGRALRSLLFLAAALVLPVLAAAPVAAQSCGADYVIQEGDSLAKIAGRVYGKTSQWTVIFYANQDRLGGGSSLIVPGLAVRIPCIGGGEPALPVTATTEAAAPAPPPKIETASITKKVQFLTADDYAPFTGRALPNGGMHPDIIANAMEMLKTEFWRQGRFRDQLGQRLVGALESPARHARLRHGFPVVSARLQGFRKSQRRTRNSAARSSSSPIPSTRS